MGKCWGIIVKRFEWPLVRKARYKCSKRRKKKKRTNKSGVRLFVRVCVSQTLPYDWLKDSLGSMHPGWHNSLSDEVGMSLVKSRTSAVGNQRVYHPSTASDRLLAGGNTLHVRDRQIKVKVVT